MSFAPLAFKLFYAARQNAVLRLALVGLAAPGALRRAAHPPGQALRDGGPPARLAGSRVAVQVPQRALPRPERGRGRRDGRDAHGARARPPRPRPASHSDSDFFQGPSGACRRRGRRPTRMQMPIKTFMCRTGRGWGWGSAPARAARGGASRRLRATSAGT